MGKNSSITIYDFLKSNPAYVKVVVDFVPYYDDTQDIFIDNLTHNKRILNKIVDKATIDVVQFHHYEISIFTRSEL